MTKTAGTDFLSCFEPHNRRINLDSFRVNETRYRHSDLESSTPTHTFMDKTVVSKEVKPPAQGHIVRRWQSQSENRGPLNASPVSFPLISPFHDRLFMETVSITGGAETPAQGPE